MSGRGWFAGPTKGGGVSVWTVDGCYNIFDTTAPGIDGKANAELVASLPDILRDLDAAREQADTTVNTLRLVTMERDDLHAQLDAAVRLLDGMLRERQPIAEVVAFLCALDAKRGA